MNWQKVAELTMTALEKEEERATYLQNRNNDLEEKQRLLLIDKEDLRNQVADREEHIAQLQDEVQMWREQRDKMIALDGWEVIDYYYDEKLFAVKTVTEKTGMSLKDAVGFVDRFMRHEQYTNERVWEFSLLSKKED